MRHFLHLLDKSIAAVTARQLIQDVKRVMTQKSWTEMRQLEVKHCENTTKSTKYNTSFVRISSVAKLEKF